MRSHPLEWSVPTKALLGERDDMTSRDALLASAGRTVQGSRSCMNDGGRRFHTDEETASLDPCMACHRDVAPLIGGRQRPTHPHARYDVGIDRQLIEERHVQGGGPHRVRLASLTSPGHVAVGTHDDNRGEQRAHCDPE